METRLAKRKKLENQTESSSALIGADHISAVFGNDVIFRKIVDYLGTPDLKILRQTCHLLLAKVNGHSKFTPNLMVTISDEAIEENILSPHRTIQWNGMTVLINQTGVRHFSRIPADSLAHLELHLEGEYGTSPTPQELLKGAPRRRACFKFLRTSELTNLESLTMDLNLFMYDIYAGALSGIVPRLKYFQLTNKCAESWENMSGRKRKTLEQNMNEIAGLPWSLKSLSSEVGFNSDPTGRALVAILATSVSTVEKIQVICFGAHLPPQIYAVRFPRLKNLETSFQFDNNAIQFTAFLNLQPKLESLDLYVAGEISPGLFDAIKTICSSNKLHTFGLATLTSFHHLDWTFIQGMKELKSITIHHVGRATNPLNMTAILSYLPSTIETIDISGAHGSPNGPISISALTGFPHLTYLDAHNCGILQIDDALQSICRTLTKLRALHFGEQRGSSVTDFGLTGKSSRRTVPDSGISLNNLKGLQELGLFGCLETTEQGLVKAVRFLELRVLEIHRVISDPVLLEIAKNNPSLESVSRDDEGLPPHLVKDEDLVFRNLLAVNPRLTRILANAE